MDKKILKKIEKALEAHFKITKETDERIYFEVASFKGSYNKIMKTQAPKWFQDFDKKNDLRWKNQEKFNANQENFNSEVVSFMKNQEKFNQRLENRIDNLVTKNQLQE